MERLALRLHDEEQDPAGTTILGRLIAALDGAEPSFDTNELYELNGPDFDLALVVLRDWRFRRHILSDIGLRATLSHLSPLQPQRIDSLQHVYPF
jgi:hypothetical protein